MKLKLVLILILLLTTNALRLSKKEPYLVTGKQGFFLKSSFGKGSFGKVFNAETNFENKKISFNNENRKIIVFKPRFAIKESRTFTNVLIESVKSGYSKIKSICLPNNQENQKKSKREEDRETSKNEFKKEYEAFQAIGAVVQDSDKQVIFNENKSNFVNNKEFDASKLYNQIKSNELQLLDYFEGDNKNQPKMLFYKYHMDANNYVDIFSQVIMFENPNKNLGEIMVKIVEVIKKFHEKGCMHGDFKLDNLLVYIENYKGIIFKSETELLPYFFVLSDFSSVKCNLKKVCEKPFTKAIYEKAKNDESSIHYAPEWYDRIATTKRDVWGVGIFLISLVSIMNFDQAEAEFYYTKAAIPNFVKENVKKLNKENNENIKVKNLLTFIWNEMLEVDYTKRTDMANALECIKLILSDTVCKKKTCKIGKDLKEYDFFWEEQT